MDALGAFLELSKLESKKVRLQVLRLVDALEGEALDVFKIARRLERRLWNDPARLASHGRAEIVRRLRAKFASEHVDLAPVDSLDEQLGSRPRDWYHQGALLLDCAEALNVHVAVYEYQLNQLRRHSGGRAPSVAYDYLAAEQQRFGKSDEEVAGSLVHVGFLPNRETYVAQFRENVVKKHRVRRLKRQCAETEAGR